MKNIFTYPDNPLYVNPDYLGETNTGLRRRISELLSGTYLGWNGLTPAFDTNTTISNISKYINYLDSVKSTENLSMYDFWLQPIVVGNKVIAAQPVTIVSGDTNNPATVTLPAGHEYVNGMRVTLSNFDGSYNNIGVNGNDFYIANTSGNDVQLTYDSALTELVGFNAPETFAVDNVIDFNGYNNPIKIDLSDHGIAFPPASSLTVNSLDQHSAAFPGTYYLSPVTPGNTVFHIYENVELTDALTYANVRDNLETETVTLVHLSNPAKIVVSTPLTSEQLKITVRDAVDFPDDNGVALNEFVENDYYYLGTTANNLEYELFYDEAKTNGVDWSTKFGQRFHGESFYFSMDGLQLEILNDKSLLRQEDGRFLDWVDVDIQDLDEIDITDDTGNLQSLIGDSYSLVLNTTKSDSIKRVFDVCLPGTTTQKTVDGVTIGSVDTIDGTINTGFGVGEYVITTINTYNQLLKATENNPYWNIQAGNNYEFDNQLLVGAGGQQVTLTELGTTFSAFFHRSNNTLSFFVDTDTDPYAVGVDVATDVVRSIVTNYTKNGNPDLLNDSLVYTSIGSGSQNIKSSRFYKTSETIEYDPSTFTFSYSGVVASNGTVTFTTDMNDMDLTTHLQDQILDTSDGLLLDTGKYFLERTANPLVYQILTTDGNAVTSLPNVSSDSVRFAPYNMGDVTYARIEAVSNDNIAWAPLTAGFEDGSSGASIDFTRRPFLTAPTSPRVINHYTGPGNVTAGMVLNAATTGDIRISDNEARKYKLSDVSIAMPGNTAYNYNDENGDLAYGAFINSEQYWSPGGTSIQNVDPIEDPANINVALDGNGRLSSVSIGTTAGRYIDNEQVMYPLIGFSDDPAGIPTPPTLAEQQDSFDTDDEWSNFGFDSRREWPRHVSPLGAEITQSSPNTTSFSQNGTKYTRNGGYTKWQMQVEYPPMLPSDFQKFHGVAQAASTGTPFYFVMVGENGKRILWKDFYRGGSRTVRLRENAGPEDTVLLFDGFAGFESGAFNRGETNIFGSNENGSLHTVVNTTDANAYGEAKARLAYPVGSSTGPFNLLYRDPYHVVVTLQQDNFQYTIDTAGFYRMSVTFDLDSFK